MWSVMWYTYIHHHHTFQTKNENEIKIMYKEIYILITYVVSKPLPLVGWHSFS